MYVCPTFLPSVGGTEKEVYNISRRLAKRGHKVTVITSNLMRFMPTNLSPEEVIDGVYVKRVKVWFPHPLCKIIFSPSIIHTLISIEADIFHVFSFLPVFLTNFASFVSLIKKKPLVLSPIYHPSRLFAYTGLTAALSRVFYERLVGLELLRKANFVMALTSSEAMYYRQCGIKNVCEVWTGIEFEEGKSKPEELEKFMRRYCLNEKTILFVGRLEKRKGVQHIIKTMPSVLKQHPDAKLLVVGEDWGYGSYLKELSRTMGCKEAIIFTGYLKSSELQCAWETAEFLILPSHFDILPRTILEAWAHKKTVIASRAGGLPDFISPDVGILVNSYDHETLANAIIGLLSKPYLSRSMGMKGYQLIKQKFTWDIVIDKIEKIYENL